MGKRKRVQEVDEEPESKKAKKGDITSLLDFPQYCDFAVGGSQPFQECGLKLNVNGIGRIDFPLTQAQAMQLCTVAAPAPFGRGELTVYDPAVRKTLQMGPDKFSVEDEAPKPKRRGAKNTAPSWNATLQSVIAQVKEGLGLSEGDVRAELYKLLLYEPGDFFAPHRDSEKGDGMFASLVFVLPSDHTGGDIVVRHKDETLEFACVGEGAMHYVAFYADCTHEVRPVTAGYRLCIIYNLYFTSKTTVVPDTLGLREAAACQLAEAFRETPPTSVMVCVLDHKYTQTGLRLATLKGRDRRLAQAVQAGLRLAGLDDVVTLLGGITCEQETGATDEGDSNGLYVDRRLFLSGLRDTAGRCYAVGEIRVQREALVPATAFTQLRAWDYNDEFNTGNEGMRQERWYTTSALVLVPRPHLWALLHGGGTLPAMLQRECTQPPSPDRITLSAAEKVDLARFLVSCGETDKCLEDFAPVMTALLALGERELVLKHIATISPRTRERWLPLPFHHAEAVAEAFRQARAACGWHALSDSVELALAKLTTENRVTDAFLRVLYELSSVSAAEAVCKAHLRRVRQVVNGAKNEIRVRGGVSPEGLATAAALLVALDDDAKHLKKATAVAKAMDGETLSKTAVGRHPAKAIRMLRVLQELLGNAFQDVPGVAALVKTVVRVMHWEGPRQSSFVIEETSKCKCEACDAMAAFTGSTLHSAEIPVPWNASVDVAAHHFRFSDCCQEVGHYPFRDHGSPPDHEFHFTWIELRPNAARTALIATKRLARDEEWAEQYRVCEELTRLRVWCPEDHHKLKARQRHALLSALLLHAARNRTTGLPRFGGTHWWRMPLELVCEVFQHTM